MGTGSYYSESLIIRKPADEAISNDATLNDDSVLTLPLSANENDRGSILKLWRIH